MNANYQTVEAIINTGSVEALNTLIEKLNENPGTQLPEYSCGEDLLYVLKRLFAAALARDNRIKQNALNALTEVKSKITTITQLKKSAFAAFFLSATDMSDCANRQQKNSYIQGKISICKIMGDYLHDEKIVAHFAKLVNDSEHLQEDLIEILFALVGQKIGGLKLKTEVPNGKLLLQVLTKKTIDESAIVTMLDNAITEYPKESIALKHLGLNFEHIVTSPQQFFKKHYAQFIDISDQQTEDGDLKKLYYLLQIQKYFLSNIQINPKNIGKFLCVEMIIVWLEELRVKNKHMKKLAGSIKISFSEQPDFCLQVLKFLHEKKMYLENISANHPFAALYRNVEPIKFWTYIVQIISQRVVNQQATEQEEQQAKAKHEEYLSELQYITRQNCDVLTPEQVGETLTILIKEYQTSKKSQKLLNLVWSLFHKLLERSQTKKSKKKIVLNTKGSLILSKIKLTELELEADILQTITKAIKFIRVKVKVHKDSEDKTILSFLNFVTGLIIYSIVYPEEAEVCGEIEFIFKDLEALLAKETGVDAQKDTLKKKRKKSQQVTEDPKKAIHVMIDVFISLLTKAPIFLRNSINLVFEQFVPFIETSDLDTLLDVIQKPDQEYIEEI